MLSTTYLIAYILWNFDFNHRWGADDVDDAFLIGISLVNAFTALSLIRAAQGVTKADGKRLEAEREVERQRTWLEAIMRQMPIGVGVLVSPGHDLVLANVQYYSLLKIDPELGRAAHTHSQLKVFDAQGQPYETGRWPSQRALATGEPVLNEELMVECGDGGKAWMLVSAGPIIDKGGSVSAVVVTFSDVTERKAAEAAYASLMRGVISIQEDERLRIARELHDELGQDLTGLAIGLKMLETSAGSDAHRTIRQLRASVQSMNEHVHHLTARLRPLMLEDFGLRQALEELTLGWGERIGVRVDIHLDDLASPPPEPAAIVAYRVVQEALTNIAKHAGASTISLTTQLSDGALRIVVEDDGAGFEANETFPAFGGHYGLAGMAERLSAIGGSLHIESSRGAGTTVYAVVPVEAGQRP